MPSIRAAFAVSVVFGAVVALGGCSKKPDASSAPPAAEPAAASQATPPPAPEAPAPAATMISLDIKDASGAAVSGDPVSGKSVFAQCETCHSKDAGTNKVGPSLHGIIGRHSGMIPNFHYSDANKNSGLVWSEQQLYAYLENPQKVVPGTFMTFTGVKDPQKRADVIAYLQENTK